MKKILVPCDFSKQAINAFRFALDVATLSKGVVHLLHVIELPALHDTYLMPVVSFEEQLLKELKEKSDERFKKLTAKYKTQPVAVVTKVQFGGASNMIQEYIVDNAIDLVIMGSHGASGAREFFVGSNAEKVVRNSHVPVMVMKEYHKGPIRKIVFPNTLQTEKQEDLIMHVKALQAFFKAQLQIVWVNTPGTFTADVITNKRLQNFAKRFMFKDYTIHVVNALDEESGILEFAAANNANLIAMGTHGRKGVAHLVAGSLAEDVVNHGTGMVWTYSLKNELVHQAD